jgi:hypothetical protein
MAIDRKKIIDAMSKIELAGNENGLIPGMGVFINQLPVDFWNDFPAKIFFKMDPNLQEAAKSLLINAGHECGYHTGYGIITSEEWKAIVQPMIEKVPEDVLHGAFAIFTAWGWGKAEIVELIPGEKMVVRAYDYYERDVLKFGYTPYPLAFMITGVSAAFMDLAYGKPYPDGLRTFMGTQVKGIECGDDYGEFVITRA